MAESGDRQALGVQWTPGRIALLVGWVGLVAAVGVAVLMAMRSGSFRPAACEAATPAAPDFAAAPFAFDPEARAFAFLQALANAEFRTAYEMSAPEPLPADSLCDLRLETDGAVLVGLDALRRDAYRQGAAADSVASVTFDPASDLLDVEVAVRPDLHVTVSLLRDGRVFAFEIDEAVQELGLVRDYPPPPYAKTQAFAEVEIEIGQAPWELGATLTLPHGPGPFPAIVLVPGSGASDRDGTWSGNKPFRDLAWGLATQGVATLRYDKRTWTHALAFAQQPDFTLDDELVDDALAAVAVIRQTPRIDPARIYVLGASLGGFAAPRIAQRNPGIDGLILVSAGSGSYFHRVAWNYEFNASADGVVDEFEQHTIDMHRATAAGLDALAAGKAAMLPMLIRPSYYLDMAEYRAEKTAQALRMPLLFLYGGRDRARAAIDREAWIRHLRDGRGTAYRLYRGHSHTLLDMREMTEPTLRRRGHVGQMVVDDIAAWISGGWPTEGCADIETLYAGCRA